MLLYVCQIVWLCFFLCAPAFQQFKNVKSAIAISSRLFDTKACHLIVFLQTFIFQLNWIKNIKIGKFMSSDVKIYDWISHLIQLTLSSIWLFLHFNSLLNLLPSVKILEKWAVALNNSATHFHQIAAIRMRFWSACLKKAAPYSLYEISV